MGRDIFSPHSPNSSWSSAFTIANLLRAERSGGSNPGRGKRSPTSLKAPRRFRGPPSLLVNGYRSFSSGLKQPEREVDHSPSSYATVRRSRTSAPPIRLHGAEMNNFTVFLLSCSCNFAFCFYHPTPGNLSSY